MKIAFITDDGETISRHFGRAKHYVIVTIENGTVTAREQVDKPSHQGHHGNHHHHDHDEPNVQLHDHEHEHDHEARHGQGAASMMAAIAGCDAVITRGMGRGAHNRIKQNGATPIITDIPRIDDAVQAYIDGTLVDHPEKLH